MKKIFCLLILGIFLQAHTVNKNSYFEFIDHKFQGSLSKEFIQKLIFTFHPDVFFETGTYDGNTTLNAANFFNQVITVEIYKPLFTQAKKKFQTHKNIHSYLGNSAKLIETLGNQIEGTILFWLDAHYSGEGTGMSDNSGSAEAITPIREELAAICKAGIKNCVILIDDIRGFGTEIGDQVFLGCWAYPTLQEVKLALLKINPQFQVALLGDTLLAYDSSKYTPDFSKTVIACTKTRLYDGQNLTNQELWDLEAQIKKAPAHEAAFIAQLYQSMTQYNDPMFWHDLWYGLIQMGKGNYVESTIALQKIPARILSGTFKSNAVNPTVYEHVSLKTYLEYDLIN